ncbi:MAG: D-aminoacyl-tRNA deacylase [Maribacter sp.]
MRVVVQRVSRASVTIEGKQISGIDSGLLILLGIEHLDTVEDVEWLSHKIINLRIFNDKEGIMNDSLLDCDGDAVVVSQFTLHAATRKGNRPSYIKAARPEVAIPLYEKFIATLEQKLGKKIGSGIFGADMKVELVNDGPVTILMDTKNKE